VSIASVGATDPCLYGCIAGIGAAAVVTIGISIFQNANYSWETLGAIRLTDDAGHAKDVSYEDPTYDPERLKKAAYVARGITLVLFLALFIIWPLTYVFSLIFPITVAPLRTGKCIFNKHGEFETALTETLQSLRHRVPIFQEILHRMGHRIPPLGFLLLLQCHRFPYH
jgi:hypothetical protein